MAEQFEVVQEGEYPASPDRVWQAVTADTAAWLFPAGGGEEIVWEPPTHRVNRMDGPDGWFNHLEQVIEASADGRSSLRWVHRGVLPPGTTDATGIELHTAFYLHTLAEYLEHFDGRQAVFVDVQGPSESMTQDAFEVVRAAIGVDPDAVVGTIAEGELPLVSSDAILDYSNAHFIGLRTDDALYRFFGRNAFGGPVGLTVHHFGDADADELQVEWQQWLDGLFGSDAPE
ncbi:SRPBCC domain-containing protein [Amnibacterium flavum]|uniref:ATPase n=1 Tax=Amnibacterium flavum TaxID=2173173 RepID=A0A2V1HQG9_9MICO|nr:SRPBCC domain-containing protein [Amnibacterium flavum]PVZ93872.1 ATPase [Amnibacterium flavum]